MLSKPMDVLDIKILIKSIQIIIDSSAFKIFHPALEHMLQKFPLHKYLAHS